MEHEHLRTQVLEDEPECRYRYPGCTVKSTVADHIVPLRLGGETVRENLAGCCRHCHAIKSARGQ